MEGGPRGGRGVDARLLLPRYGWIDPSGYQRLPEPLGVPMGDGERWCGVLRGELGGAPIYLLEHDVYFGRSALYHDEHGAYGDNVRRYALLCRAAMQLCHALDFWPDVFHGHDWQGAMLPLYLDIGLDPRFRRTASVLTIHNLAHQGWFGHGDAAALCLGGRHLGRLGLEVRGTPNVLCGGLLHATQITTV